MVLSALSFPTSSKVERGGVAGFSISRTMEHFSLITYCGTRQ